MHLGWKTYEEWRVKSADLHLLKRASILELNHYCDEYKKKNIYLRMKIRLKYFTLEVGKMLGAFFFYTAIRIGGRWLRYFINSDGNKIIYYR